MKTTFAAKRRRPSKPGEDDFLAFTRWKTTFASPEDDLPLQPSASDALALPTHEVGPGSGLYPRSSTLVHDTSRSTGPRVTAPSPKHDDRYSIGLRSHLFGVVSGQPPGACHQLKRHRSHCRSTSIIHSEHKPVPSQL